MAEDYYGILGVSKSASADEIKNAYRTLALKLHPDVNKSKQAEEKFKKINEAYAVLGEPDKRKQYDSFGPDAFNQRFTQEDIFRNANFNDIFKNMGFDFGPDNDIFSQMFGFTPQRSADVGNDILARVNVTLQDAAHGATKILNVRHVKACGRCDGKGYEPGTRMIKCERCNGTGQLRQTQRTPFGVMQTIGTCSSCGGAGRTFEKPCKSCGGRGAMQAEDRIDVTIPKGVSTGMRLRLAGMGDFGKDRRGDLYIDIGVQQDRRFERKADDVHADLHIPLHVALLGGEVMAPTLDGDKKVSIEEGTQNNSKVVMRDHGIPHFNRSGAGDEILNIIVDLPKHLSRDQKELVKKLSDSGSDGDKRRMFGIF